MASHDDIISISKDGDAVKVEFLTSNINEATMMHIEHELLGLASTL